MAWRVCSKSNLFPWVLGARLTASTTAFRNQKLNTEFPDVYRNEYLRSIQNPEEYWAEVSTNTVWTKPWEKVLDDSKSPLTKWFVGGRLSLCYNAIDRHVDEGNGEKAALIWDSAVTGQCKSYTYANLQDEVASVAGMLAKQGICKGDMVVIYMPMIPEAIIGMLATVRLGAVHSVVFGGFSAAELGNRIKHCQPKAILTTNVGIEGSKILEYKPVVDEAKKIAGATHVPVFVHQRTGYQLADISHYDFEWNEEAPRSSKHDCVEVDSNDPLYVLYTSGTTGEPKGVVHATGPHAVVNKWTMNALYGMNPGNVWWAASDIGWIVGHEYICYSPLMSGCATVLYEGKPVGTPDAGQFFRVIDNHKVNGFFVAPTALRAIKSDDPECKFGSKYDISSLKYVFVAGEHCDPETRHFTQRNFKVPVLNNWWQTETGHAITGTCIGLGNKLDTSDLVTGLPVPGFNIHVVDPQGIEVPPGTEGNIVCKLPMPPGTIMTLFNNDERFKSTYFSKFKGYYDTMDAGFKCTDNYVTITDRVDDVINVAGHRISTSALEDVLLEHPCVSDAAVVGVPCKLKGQIPLGLVVVQKGVKRKTLKQDLIKMVREKVGPVAFFKEIIEVHNLPRTKSGKTPRKTIADLASGKAIRIPPTIEDPSVYQEMKEAMEEYGLITGFFTVSKNL